MNSLHESLLLAAVKLLGAIVRALPYRVSLSLGRGCGAAGYFFMGRKRKVVYGNLKTVFGGEKTPKEIERLTRQVFCCLPQTIIDVLCLPKVASQGYDGYVRLHGKENIDAAIKSGRGLILLGIHSGSWELASIVGSSLGYPYNVVANTQTKIPKLGALLNRYRVTAGAKVIVPESGVTRDIIRALKNNEIVTLVLDMGGEEGIPVNFLGKTASLSTGALRLGMKLKTPVCPVWIFRGEDGTNDLRVLPPLDLDGIEETPRGLKTALTKAAGVFEPLLRAHPQEYLWTYKFFKYSTQSSIVVLDDGRTGHLRQSQAAAAKLASVLKKKGMEAAVKTVPVEFKSAWWGRCFALYTFLMSLFRLSAQEKELEFFLKEGSFGALSKQRGDWIISCGSVAGGVNFFLKRCYNAKSICLLKAGLVGWEHFDLAIAPEHDRRGVSDGRAVFTKAALNLISPEYLKEQQEGLLAQYSHLKNNVRMKIGVLLGGNTKGVEFEEGAMRLLLSKIKEAALHFHADVLITTSRRTPPEVDTLVAREIKNFERTALCVIANSNNTPFAVGGILALSDLLIVSGESISMVSEAVSSGKSTIVFKSQGSYDDPRLNKFDRFVLSLSDGGFIIACSIKEVGNSIAKMMSHKITLKALADNALVTQAMEKVVQ